MHIEQFLYNVHNNNIALNCTNKTHSLSKYIFVESMTIF